MPSFKAEDWRRTACTTARESTNSTKREHTLEVDSLFGDENLHPNIMKSVGNQKVQSSIKTTLKDRAVVTNIINKYQNIKIRPIRD